MADQAVTSQACAGPRCRARDHRDQGRAPRPPTRSQYQMLLDKFIYPTFGHERIDRISNDDVNDWYDALAPGRELAELRRGDIDLRTNRVKNRRGVVRVDGEFIVGPPKSDAGCRDVAIPPHLVPLVKDHLRNLTAPGRDALLSLRLPTTTCTWLRQRSTRSTTRPGGRRSRGSPLARSPPHRSCAGRPDRRDTG